MNGDEYVFLGIRASTIVASLLIVVLVAVAHVGLKWWTRRRARLGAAKEVSAADAGGGVHRWLNDSFIQLVGPVALLLWIYGAHFALVTLLAEVPIDAIARYVIPGLNALRGIAVILALMWLLSRVGRRIEVRLGEFAGKSESRSDDFFLPIVGVAVRLLLPMLAIILGLPALSLPGGLTPLLKDGISLVLIGTLAFIFYQLVDAICRLVVSRHPLDVRDNRAARSIYTQVTVLRKVALVIIGVFALASMLMVFEPMRRLGTTLLASAGVAGIVIGLAAQRSVATLLAGFQIALTQPIRIDDVVIVENEWGRIEEITLTYVVVHIWDQRRLVVPITYFLEKPFQNWTRTSADLLATVFLFVDYTVPLNEVRAELTRILESSKLWDRKVNVLQVTDSTERTMQIRALASAADAGLAWDLRCEVREKLILFLQSRYPESLPRIRLEQAQA